MSAVSELIGAFNQFDRPGQSLRDSNRASIPPQDLENVHPAQTKVARNRARNVAVKLRPADGAKRPCYSVSGNGVTVHDNRCTPVGVNLSTGICLPERRGIGLVTWPEKMRQLRALLGVNQAKFARMLGVTQQAVSKWEAGQREPGGSVYLQCAKLAGTNKELRDFFWERANLDAPSVAAALQPEPASDQGPTLRRAECRTVEIPILLQPLYASAPALAPRDAARCSISLPQFMVPRPHKTSCLQVADNAMRPLLRPGDLVVVDATQTNPALIDDRTLVAALAPTGELKVRWVRQRAGRPFLASQQEDDQEIDLAGGGESWRVLGCVLWYLGRGSAAQPSLNSVEHRMAR